VNILFDEDRLQSVFCCTAGHVAGHAENIPQKLATSAQAFELVCRYGDPRFIVRIVPVSNLNTE